MTKARPKPPPKTKAQLVVDVAEKMRRRWDDPLSGHLFLLNYFTAVDLTMIEAELDKPDVK